MSRFLEDLEAMRVKLKAAVDWNFGVVGSDATANARLEDVQRLEANLKVYNPEEFKQYFDKYY